MLHPSISGLKIPLGGPVLGIGVDIESVSRIAEIHARQGSRFLDRVYTKEEQDYCLGMKYAAKHLAARFAAKEAVAKAFTTGIGAHLGWTSVSVSRGKRGQPEVVLDEKGLSLLNLFGGARVAISLSHGGDQAVAFAVIIGRREKQMA